MRSSALSTIAAILGWFVIVVIPGTFFAFGWKDFELRCHRTAAGQLPSCIITESFAMGLYNRSVRADNITQIGYSTGTVKQALMAVHPSTMVFGTTGDEVKIGHVTSAIDTSGERELILKTRAFLNASDSLGFTHKASMHGLFGYVGLIGVAFLLFIIAAVLWHHLRSAVRRKQRGN